MPGSHTRNNKPFCESNRRVRYCTLWITNPPNRETHTPTRETHTMESGITHMQMPLIGS